MLRKDTNKRLIAELRRDVKILIIKRFNHVM